MRHRGHDSIRHMIDADDLPESMAYMSEIIGLEATLKIATECGGLRLYVPVRIATDHWLYDLIGEEAFTKLVRHFQAEEIEIARCQQALANARARTLLDRHTRGDSIAALAREYGMTERGVRNACRRAAR